MKSSARQELRKRAEARCEYCQFPEHYAETSFHVDHIRPQKHGGGDEVDNLAWACSSCSLFKGYAISGFDEEGALIRLFHPRLDPWHEHFEWIDARLVGLTEIGKVTVEVLKINLDDRMDARETLINEGVTFE